MRTTTDGYKRSGQYRTTDFRRSEGNYGTPYGHGCRGFETSWRFTDGIFKCSFWLEQPSIINVTEPKEILYTRLVIRLIASIRV
jgi:hypothetical protein